MEPLNDVSDEAYQLALGAGLDDVVSSLFRDGEELFVPGLVPPPELIPTVIQVGGVICLVSLPAAHHVLPARLDFIN